MKNIIEWYEESLFKINNNEEYNVSDIHIDRVMKVNSKSRKEMYEKAIQIWNELCSHINVKDLKGKVLAMDIVLEENEGKLLGVMRTEDEIISGISLHDMPEIMLYEASKTDKIIGEYYNSALPFKIDELNANTVVSYQEYRSFEELLEEDEYTRFICFTHESCVSKAKYLSDIS